MFIFSVKRDMDILLSVKSETAILFFVKRDEDPPLPPSTVAPLFYEQIIEIYNIHTHCM